MVEVQAQLFQCQNLPQLVQKLYEFQSHLLESTENQRRKKSRQVLRLRIGATYMTGAALLQGSDWLDPSPHETKLYRFQPYQHRAWHFFLRARYETDRLIHLQAVSKMSLNSYSSYQGVPLPEVSTCGPSTT